MSLPPSAGPGWLPAPPNQPAIPRLEFAKLNTATFAIFRRGFGPLLALGAVPAVLSAAATYVLMATFAGVFLTSLVARNAAGLAGGPLLVIAGASLAIMLVTAQCGAMTVQIATQVANGQPPSLARAWRETSTITGRLLLPYLISSVTGWLFAAVGASLLLNSLLRYLETTAGPGEDRVATVVLVLVGCALLVSAVWAVLSYLLRIKFFLFLPAASLERLSGFAALRRSWQLTRGIAGVVLGALLLVGLAEVTVGGLAGQVGSSFANGQLELVRTRGLDGLSSAMLAAILVPTLAGAVVASFTQPFLTVMSTIAFWFQTRPSRTTG